MKLPVLKSLAEYMENTTQVSKVEATVEVLELLSQVRGFKEEEKVVIGELISNLLGSIEVKKSIDGGQETRDALNGFMQRVLGSIDR